MAFEIGQRVISKFYGVGTVKSELFRDTEDDPKHPVTYQRVLFDKSGIETAVMVAKIEPYEDPIPKKGGRGAKKVAEEKTSQPQANTEVLGG